MAVDKAVDSAQLDLDLGSVADSIRAVSEGSSALAFPAGFNSALAAVVAKIGTDGLTAILASLNASNNDSDTTVTDAVLATAAAKAAIASAITAKGGTVGQSDGLEDFAAAIAGIPGGGGITDYDIGYTYPSAVNRLHIPYNPNKTPAFVVCFSKEAWQAGGLSCGGFAVKDIYNNTTGIHAFAACLPVGSSEGKLYYNTVYPFGTELSANCITFDRVVAGMNWNTSMRVDYFVAYNADNTLHWRDNS